MLDLVAQDVVALELRVDFLLEILVLRRRPRDLCVQFLLRICEVNRRSREKGLVLLQRLHDLGDAFDLLGRGRDPRLNFFQSLFIHSESLLDLSVRHAFRCEFSSFQNMNRNSLL